MTDPIPASVHSDDLWAMPEFQAVLDKLGVDRSLPTTTLTITLPWTKKRGDCLVRIAHDYFGAERHLPVDQSIQEKRYQALIAHRICPDCLVKLEGDVLRDYRSPHLYCECKTCKCYFQVPEEE